MPANLIIDKVFAIQYTGSNSAEIAGLVTNTATVSETGGVWTVQSPSGSTVYTINTNDFVRYGQNQIYSSHPVSQFNTNFVEVDVAAGVDDLAAIVVTGAGSAPVPTLLLNASSTVAVNLVPAQPDTSYTPNVMIIGAPTILGALNITAISIVDTDTVNVTVQNTGLASLSGASLLITVTA